MSGNDELEQLRRDVRYLKDRIEILDCVAKQARGHDRHDAALMTSVYHARRRRRARPRREPRPRVR